MCGVAERAGVALGLVAGRQLQAARVHVPGQILRAAIPGARHVGDRDAPRCPHHLPALEPDVLAPGLQQAGADRQHALGQLVAGRRYGAARHDHAARAPGARGIGRLGGVAVHETDAVVRNAEHGVGDLRQRRLQSLSVAVGADLQLQCTVRREAGVALLVPRHERNAPGRVHAGAVARLLGVHRKADADAAAVGLALPLACAHAVEADGLDRPAQRLGVVARVEVALGDVVEGHLLGADQALEAHLVGLAPELAGERIQRHFQREAHPRAGDAAVGQDGRLVGRDRIGAAAVVGKVVETRQDRAHLTGLQAGRERVGRVGAGIDGRLAVEPQQPAIGVRVGSEHVVVLAAVGVGGEALAAVLQPSQGRTQPARCPRQRHLFRQQDALVAEAAADIGRDHADLPLVDAEAFGETGADDVGLLGGGMDDELAEPRVPGRHHAAAFERAHHLARGGQLARHRHRGLRLDRLEVDVDAGRQEQVVAPGLVHQRRAGLAGGEHVAHDRQGLEIELDLAREILGLRARRRHAHRHQLADIAHLAGGEDRLHRGLEAGKRGVGADGGDPGQVLGNEHPVADRRRDADGLDAPMGQRAAHEGHVQHAGQLDIADVLAPPTQVAVVLLAGEPRADALVRHHAPHIAVIPAGARQRAVTAHAPRRSARCSAARSRPDR